jgi:hypothetical protein
MAIDYTVTATERDLLRRLAARKVELAAGATNQERKRAWYALDSGAADRRPMILAEIAGVRDERRPLSDSVLQCQSEFARRLEWGLRFELYQYDVLQDDHVLEPWHNVGWHVTTSNYGVTAVVHRSEDQSRMGSKRWDPPIVDLDRDFAKLKPRTYSVDRAATAAEVEATEDVFRGILPVRIRRSFWWTLGMTIVAIDLIGLDNLMVYMYDNPDGLHRLMRFLHDDHLAYARWLESEGLLCLNNENDYIGSGSMGYTHDLPRPGAPTGRVRLCDQWVLLESQETVGVGPNQFAEFIYPYQASLAQYFGKVYYGCCEPVSGRWEVLKCLPNLARVSVSPWADQSVMGAGCSDRLVFSRKPNPTLISTEHFDEAAILADLRQTLTAGAQGRLEIIMKDVHTLNNEPDRLTRWVALARQAVREWQEQR